MTITNFNKLDGEQKIKATWRGRFIAVREDKRALLYLLNNFFVEVCYDNVRDEIPAISAYSVHRLPEHYFELIKIPRIGNVRE